MHKILLAAFSFMVAVMVFLYSNQIKASEANLIGGEKVPYHEYREVVRIFMSGGGSCSAVVVGPRLVITAAHCAEHGDISFQAYNRMLYQGECRLAPGYRRQVDDQDIAICLLDKTHPQPYASVAQVAPKVGEEVILMGVGGTSIGGGGGNDGFLRKGRVRVVRESDELSHSFYTRGSVALCYGDSGGPSYRVTPDNRHIVIGVNSRGNIRDLSLMTSVAHPSTLEWLSQIEEETQEMICGLSAECPYLEKKPQGGCLSSLSLLSF